MGDVLRFTPCVCKDWNKDRILLSMYNVIRIKFFFPLSIYRNFIREYVKVHWVNRMTFCYTVMYMFVMLSYLFLKKIMSNIYSIYHLISTCRKQTRNWKFDDLHQKDTQFRSKNVKLLYFSKNNISSTPIQGIARSIIYEQVFFLTPDRELWSFARDLVW